MESRLSHELPKGAEIKNDIENFQQDVLKETFNTYATQLTEAKEKEPDNLDILFVITPRGLHYFMEKEGINNEKEGKEKLEELLNNTLWFFKNAAKRSGFPIPTDVRIAHIEYITSNFPTNYTSNEVGYSQREIYRGFLRQVSYKLGAPKSILDNVKIDQAFANSIDNINKLRNKTKADFVFGIDGDPNTSTGGYARRNDSNNPNFAVGASMPTRDIILHEMGHMFGMTHEESGTNKYGHYTLLGPNDGFRVNRYSPENIQYLQKNFSTQSNFRKSNQEYAVSDIGEAMAYPNPFDTETKISNTNKPFKRIQVFDIRGHSVYKSTLEESTTQVTIGDFKSSGLYLYILYGEDGKTVGRGKIVKKK